MTTPHGEDILAGQLWEAARTGPDDLGWPEAWRLAATSGQWKARVDATLRQAGHVRSLIASATEDADARFAKVVQERDDAVETLDAWFARTALVGKATQKAIHDAAAGYLRTSRVGGMPTEQSDLVMGVIDGMIGSGMFSDVLARAQAVPHASERSQPIPPKPLPRSQALFALLDECRAANVDLDPDDARSVAAAAVQAEALELLEATKHPFAVTEDVAKVRAITQAVAVARTSPDGPHGTHAVMRGLVNAVRLNAPVAEPRMDGPLAS